MNIFLLLYVFFAGVTLCPVFLYLKNKESSSTKICEMDTLDIFMVLIMTIILTGTWPILLVYGAVCLLQKLFVVLDV